MKPISLKDGLLLRDRIKRISVTLIILVTICCAVGFLLLYSAANQDLMPWSFRQMCVFLLFFPVMMLIGILDIRLLYKNSYVLYFAGLVFLLIVHVVGHKAMGAQRWLRIYGFGLQPSEFMKIFVIMALARYYHKVHSCDVKRVSSIVVPLLIIMVPTILILKQPNLGTASLVLLSSVFLLFLAGVRLWKFIVSSLIIASSLPLIWLYYLRDYQKQRLLTFLNPESDALGAGYNIIQSMIAIGSGGVSGKGFGQGTQSSLSFLPEKQTDFIFTILAEEFGFIGCAIIIAIYAIIIIYGYLIAISTRNQYSRLLISGLVSLFAIQMIVNTAMISGLIPVVGIPLPFLSFGGSNLMSMMMSFGIIICANVNKHASGIEYYKGFNSSLFSRR